MKKCTHKYVKGGETNILTTNGGIIKIVIFCEKCGDFKNCN